MIIGERRRCSFGPCRLRIFNGRRSFIWEIKRSWILGTGGTRSESTSFDGTLPSFPTPCRVPHSSPHVAMSRIPPRPTGAALVSFHHQRPVIPRTDTTPPVGDNGTDLLCQGRSVPRQKGRPSERPPHVQRFSR